MKEVCIFGNGKSLEGFEFNKIDREKYDIIGTGMAFRHWNKIDWFPNIYVNVDTVVCQNPEVIEFVKEEKCDFYIVSKAMLQKDEKLNHISVHLIMERPNECKVSFSSLLCYYCRVKHSLKALPLMQLPVVMEFKDSNR